MAQKGPLALRLWQFKSAFIDGAEFPIDDLAFLERHRPSLRRLDIGGEQPLDVAQLNAMSALETLVVDADGGATGPLRLAGLPNLRHLTVVGLGEGPGRLTIDWAGAPQLQTVALEEVSAADLAAIAGLNGLFELTLTAPPHFPQVPLTVERLTLEGPIPGGPVVALPALEELTLLDATGLADLTRFAGSAALSDLELIGVSGLRSLHGISMRAGGAVLLDDCPDLVDISALNGAPDLDVTIKDCPGLVGGAA